MILKRTVLLIIFLIVEAAIVLAFLANTYFATGDKLVNTYLWKDARGAYEKAMALNPFNTKYITALGDFYLRRSAEKREERAHFFEKAEGFYARASELNPRSAEYTVTLGRMQTGLFLEDKETYKDKLEPGLANLKRSFVNDPNGFNTSFLAGYTAIPFWGNLDEEGKALVESRLKYVLQTRPWHGNSYIYPRAWQYTKDFDLLKRITPDSLESNKVLLYFIEKNSLGEFYLEQRRKVDLDLQKEYPDQFARMKEEDEELIGALPLASGTVEHWAGRSADRQHAYERNAMYWTGTMHALLDLPGGHVTIIVRAKGTPAGGVFPYMIVELGGEEIGGVFVKSLEWKDYAFTASTEAGEAVLSITYANNASSERKGEDRNLFVKEAAVIKNE